MANNSNIHYPLVQQSQAVPPDIQAARAYVQTRPPATAPLPNPNFIPQASTTITPSLSQAQLNVLANAAQQARMRS